jgi:hypothetical protein
MADLLPKFKVTDPHFRVGSPQERRDTGKLSNTGEGKARTVSIQCNLCIYAYIQVQSYQWQVCRERPQSHFTYRAVGRRTEWYWQ